MFYLKASEAKANALRAFEEGRLQCQQKYATAQACRYSGPCGIGVSLTEEMATEFDALSESSIYSLLEYGLVETDDRDTLEQLQVYHDSCMNFWDDDTSRNLKRFEAFLRG